MKVGGSVDRFVDQLLSTCWYGVGQDTNIVRLDQFKIKQTVNGRYYKKGNCIDGVKEVVVIWVGARIKTLYERGFQLH